MAGTFLLEIHTPYRLFFRGKAVSFSATLRDGRIGVLAGRSPFAAPLEACELVVELPSGERKTAAAAPGVVESTGSATIVLCGAAEWAQEIDVPRAEEAAARAGEHLAEDLMRYQHERAAAALARARNRLAVAAAAKAAPERART